MGEFRNAEFSVRSESLFALGFTLRPYYQNPGETMGEFRNAEFSVRSEPVFALGFTLRILYHNLRKLSIAEAKKYKKRRKKKKIAKAQKRKSTKEKTVNSSATQRIAS